MRQYKLSYNVNGDRVEQIANTEIELAANILDMERDVGIICYGVSIEQGEFDPEQRLKANRESLMDQMIHHCKVLKQAYKKKQM